MGLKDLEDGTGHTLSLELGLEYLYLEGPERAAGGANTGAANTGAAEQVAAAAQCPDITTSTSNYCSSIFSEDISDSEDESSKPTADADPVADCRSKVDFALKLGYSEELVLLVLGKLGPDALINDVLGELVKLGTKSEPRPHGESFSTTAPSTSPWSSLEPCRPLCPSQWAEDKENLRPVVVDGSNVAMSHGNKEVFSCQGIQLAVDWFLERGHRDITVFVPAWRKEQSRPDALITDQETLCRLEKQKILVFTPSRRVQGRRVVCYDDRFIVKLAYECDGIIVSNDNYRDLANEKPEWKKFIDQRLLMYSFVNDKFMPPDDPLGRHGPSLENFLRKRPVISEHRRQPCPYGKKCTYGHKCKFYHPERGNQPQRAVADELRASAKISSASRGLTEDTLSATGHRLGEVESTEQPEHWQSTPKKHMSLSLRGSLTDLCEDRRKLQSRRGSSSSSSSGCSSFLGYPAPGGPPSPVGLERWDCLGIGAMKGICKALGESRCESPEVGYSSLEKAYSTLSLEVPESPEHFSSGPDFKPESLPSDCSSEGCSNIFSPDPIVDNGAKFNHLHKRYPCHDMHSSRHRLQQKTFSQDMPKQQGLETHFTFEESLPFHHSGPEHSLYSLQGRSQDLPKHVFENDSSFRDPPYLASHRSLLSIANGSGNTPQVYTAGLPKPHDLQHRDSFEHFPSPVSSRTTLMCRANSPGINHPQSHCHSSERSFSLEECTSSHASPCPGMNQHSPQTYPVGFGCFEPPLSHGYHGSFNHPKLNKQSPQGYPTGISPSSVSTHTSQHSFMPRSAAYSSPKDFSREFYCHPQTPLPQQPSSRQGYNTGSPWHKGGLPDSTLYNATNSSERSQMTWNMCHQQSYDPYHLFANSLKDVSDRPWNSPWGRLLSPKGAPSVTAHPSTTSSDLHQQQDPPALSRFQDLRQKLFMNLCGIFPPDLVRLVMSRNPHMNDPQELAAAVLLAKAGCST